VGGVRAELRLERTEGFRSWGVGWWEKQIWEVGRWTHSWTFWQLNCAQLPLLISKTHFLQSRHRAVARLPPVPKLTVASRLTEKPAITRENQHFSSFISPDRNYWLLLRNLNSIIDSSLFINIYNYNNHQVANENREAISRRAASSNHTRDRRCASHLVVVVVWCSFPICSLIYQPVIILKLIFTTGGERINFSLRVIN